IGSAIAALLFGTLAASAQDTTADELHCQLGSALAIGKFIREKAKCIDDCEKQARVSNQTPSCGPPYGGSLQGCVNQAEGKAGGSINSSCAHDCPECYAAGACDPQGNPQVASAETHVEALATDVFCDDSGSADGLTGS